MARILNVLLVEDDQLIQYAMVEALSQAGHIVSVAGTAQRAIDVLAHHHYLDVILLDLCLGQDRGEDIFLRLRADGVAFPPVIIVSAQPIQEIKRAEVLIDASSVLQKPVTVSEICSEMERAVA